MSTFSAMPRRRRRGIHLTRRDVAILELLVTRRVETIDFLHESQFAGLSRKRALNRLGELIAAGYLERTSASLPGEEGQRSVYWLTPRARTALQIRSPAGDWFRSHRWNLDLAEPSIPHQVVTNRVCDWLGAHAIPEHLLPVPNGRHGSELSKHRPDAVYHATEADDRGRRLVFLEVDLGHYSRKRIEEKVHAALAHPEMRFLLLACPTEERQRRLIAVVSELGGHVCNRVDVMTFAQIRAGVAPGYPSPDEGLRPGATGVYELR